jgi:hypothetical protein
MQEKALGHRAWFIAAALVVCVGLLCVAEASQDVPTGYALHQNEPNPFCADSLGECTLIRFGVPALAYVRVVVADATDLIVMRTLTIGELDAGYYLLTWDGRDDWGGYMRSDDYPYSLQERDPETGRWSIVRRRVLTINCTTSTESVTWARIKALYSP